MERQLQLKTNIGTIYVCGTEKSITYLAWTKQNVPFLSEHDSDVFQSLFKRLETELEEYLNGRRTSFTVPVEPDGTEFQKSAWQALLKIPYGKTVSYLQIAKDLGDAKASRAVGAANGKNPICILIPCHRVIAQNGSLSGYLGGVHIKQKLLNLEDPVRFPQV